MPFLSTIFPSFSIHLLFMTFCSLICLNIIDKYWMLIFGFPLQSLTSQGYLGFLLDLRALHLPVKSSHSFAQLGNTFGLWLSLFWTSWTSCIVASLRLAVTCEHHGLLKRNGTDYGAVAMFLAVAVGYDAHAKMVYL